MSRIARKKFGTSEVVAITDGATELESELFPNADSDISEGCLPPPERAGSRRISTHIWLSIKAKKSW